MTADASNSECRNKEEEEFQSKLHRARYVTYFEKSVFTYLAESIIGPGVFLAAATSASILARKQLLRDLVLIICCSLLAGVGLHYFDIQVAETDANRLVKLVQDFQSLCTFLLGFFVSTCVTRWWAIRNDCIGMLWGCSDDLALIIGSYFGRDTEMDREVRETVRRWSVLSYELVYKQAQAQEDLTDLVRRDILKEHERELLLEECSKPQVIWGWMCSYFSHLAYGDPDCGGSRLPYPVTTLPQLHEICRHARGAIGALFAYTDTQVPFRYVHFLALVIWMHNLFQAVASACVISNAFPDQMATICIEVIFLFFHPIVYFGLLHLGVGLLNPLRGKRDVDFPKGAWSFYMSQEIKSIFDANSKPKGPPWGGPALFPSGSSSGSQFRNRGGISVCPNSGDITVRQTPMEEEGGGILSSQAFRQTRSFGR